ncbi:MAG: hypothetical protein IPP80_00440 [Ignavibacteria bacterium]|nr:hypothetical protein [Ignavibacteria bacterium]
MVTGSQISRSQIFVEVDGGVGGVRAWGYTTYVYNPLCDWSNTQRNQYIFRASELSSRGMTPGQIASIAINIRNATPWPVNRSVTIRMASTAANALTGRGTWRIHNGLHQPGI